MGIKLFSSTTTKHYTSDQNTTPNPNKHNFSVETEKKIGNLLIALVHYPNCTTYNGNKVLVIKNETTVRNKVQLDPHFLEDNDLDIIARFPASDEGIDAAYTFANAMKSK